MSFTKAQLQDIERFQKRAIATAHELDGLVKGLDNRTAPLQGFWQGDGGNAFRSTLQTVQEQTAVMNQALGSLGHRVGVAGQTYARADADMSHTMNKAGGAATGLADALRNQI